MDWNQKRKNQRMKKSLLIVLLFVGVGRAASWKGEWDGDWIVVASATGEENLTGCQFIKLYGKHVLVCPQDIRKKSSIEICDHKWEKSEWYLEHEMTKEEKQCLELLMTNCQHKVMGVEVCSKCGILRITPKDLK